MDAVEIPAEMWQDLLETTKMVGTSLTVGKCTCRKEAIPSLY